MKILVLRYPDKSTLIVEKKFRTLRIVDARPEECDEVRVVLGAGIFYRFVTLEGRNDAELIEAAKYSVEPTLPLPLGDLALAAFVTARSGRRKEIVVTAIPQKNLDEIIAAAPKPPAWVGSVIAACRAKGNESVRGDGWAAIARDRQWIAAQSAPETAQAVAALETAHGPREWMVSRAEDEALGAAAARDGSWTRPPETRRAQARNLAPIIAGGVALFLLLSAFAIRYVAAERRGAAADREIAANFERALPGVRMNMPREQIMARLKDARTRHDILADRFEKTGSAVGVLAAIEDAAAKSLTTDTAAPALRVLLNDLRISEKDFTVIGSAIDVETIQSFFAALKAAQLEATDPEVRRSPAGLGFDFTIRGTR